MTDLDQDVPDVRRQTTLAILLLEGFDDLYALLDQLAGDGRDPDHAPFREDFSSAGWDVSLLW